MVFIVLIMLCKKNYHTQYRMSDIEKKIFFKWMLEKESLEFESITELLSQESYANNV